VLGVKHNLDAFGQQLRAGGQSTAPIEEVGCFLGYHYSRVTVDREVLYCCNTAVQVGRLGEEANFGRLWHGDTWRKVRARLRSGDFLEGCDQCGKFNQNLKLSERFRERFGHDAWNEARGLGTPRVLRVLP
jgi:hypothetical protein